MTSFDSLQKVVCSVVDTGNDLSETFSVGSPLDNDLLQAVGSLEITNDY